jgi:hypothetical protein
MSGEPGFDADLIVGEITTCAQVNEEKLLKPQNIIPYTIASTAFGAFLIITSVITLFETLPNRTFIAPYTYTIVTLIVGGVLAVAHVATLVIMLLALRVNDEETTKLSPRFMMTVIKTTVAFALSFVVQQIFSWMFYIKWCDGVADLRFFKCRGPETLTFLTATNASIFANPAIPLPNKDFEVFAQQLEAIINFENVALLIGLLWVVLVPALVEHFSYLMTPEITVRALTAGEAASLQQKK